MSAASSGPGAGDGADARGFARLPQPGVLGSASRRLLWGHLGGDARRGRARNGWQGRGPAPGVLLTLRSGPPVLLGAWGMRDGGRACRGPMPAQGVKASVGGQTWLRAGALASGSVPAGRGTGFGSVLAVRARRTGARFRPVKVALAPSPVPRQRQVLGRQAPRSPCAPGPAGESWEPGRRARPPSLSPGTGGSLTGDFLAGAGSEPWPGLGMWGGGRVGPPGQRGLSL